MPRFFMILLLSGLLGWTCTSTPPEHPDPLQAILQSAPQIVKDKVDSLEYEVQILYTQIERDKDNRPHLTSFYINWDDDKYFYPASTVKMPVAFLALQRIHELQQEEEGISRYSRLQIDSMRPPQSPISIDTLSSTGYPNVAHYVEQIFSVSDNNAYNRLYEFLGQDYINEELKKKGIFQKSRIRTRVGISGFDTEMNKYTNPVSILDEDGNTLYEQDEYYALYSEFDSLDETSKGIGYWDDNLDTVVYRPFDMSAKNFITLTDLEASLSRIIFPEIYPGEKRFDLSNDQYQYLYNIMPKTPLEFAFNQGHADEYYDSYVKFFINGDSEEPIPDHIRVFNKVGWAYGTLTDCSYIIDTKNKIEFFLTATILVNKNQIFNDGKYEYESKGLPFFAALGNSVYEYELTRNRKYSPDFSKFFNERQNK